MLTTPMISYLRSWWFGATPSTSTASDEPDISSAPDTSAVHEASEVRVGEAATSRRHDTETADVTEITTVLVPVSPADADVTPSQSHFPTIPTISIPDTDDNTPPPFPSLNSIQRASSKDTPPVFPALNSVQRSSSNRSTAHAPDSELMPPPPLPAPVAATQDMKLNLIPPAPKYTRIPPTRGANTIVPAPNANTLIIPSNESTSATLPNSRANTLTLPSSTTRPPRKPRKKVMLAPGHSPLDWAALKTSGENLRGISTLTRIPPSILATHNTREDAWTAIAGKVYNITPYLPFHPGGEKELMRVAGRDGTKLFALTHSWVSADVMLDECLVGFLVPEQ